MKKNALIIFTLILSLLLSACGKAPEEKDAVSLWCLDSEPLRPGLEALIDEYNAGREDGLLPVKLRSFPDEESLARGFDTLRPDILICSELRAEALTEQGIARDLSSLFFNNPPLYPDYISGRLPCSGKSYLPMGALLPLLAGSRGSLSGEEGFEELMKKAADYGLNEGRPFLAVESYAPVFYQNLLSCGLEFHAEAISDGKNPQYAACWNLIADAAFTGGLAMSEYPAAELLASGAVPCAILSSAEAAKLPDGEFDFYLMPAMGGGDNYLSSLRGLCLTAREGRDCGSAEEFILWLFSSCRAGELSLSSGLLPLSPIRTGEPREGTEALLLLRAPEIRLHLPEAGSDYVRNRSEFCEKFTDSLSLVG